MGETGYRSSFASLAQIYTVDVLIGYGGHHHSTRKSRSAGSKACKEPARAPKRSDLISTPSDSGDSLLAMVTLIHWSPRSDDDFSSSNIHRLHPT